MQAIFEQLSHTICVLLDESHALTSYANRNLCVKHQNSDSGSSSCHFVGCLPCQIDKRAEEKALISAPACCPTNTQTNHE